MVKHFFLFHLIHFQLINILLPEDEDEKCPEIVMEVGPGVGGQEAALFAKDLYDLYCNYMKFTGFGLEVFEMVVNEIGAVCEFSKLIENSIETEA